MLDPESFEALDRCVETLALELSANATPAPERGEDQVSVQIDLHTLSGHLVHTVLALSNCVHDLRNAVE